MSTEENKALIRRYFEAIDAACEAGNANILDEFLRAEPDGDSTDSGRGNDSGHVGAHRIEEHYDENEEERVTDD